MSSSHCNVKDFEFKYYLDKKISWEWKEGSMDCLHFGIFFPILNTTYDFNKTLCDRYMLENDGAKILDCSYIDVLKDKILSTSICVECLNDIYKTLTYFKRLNSVCDYYDFNFSEKNYNNILKYIIFRCRDRWHDRELDLANHFLLGRKSKIINVWFFKDRLSYMVRKNSEVYFSNLYFFDWSSREDGVKKHLKIQTGNFSHHCCEDSLLQKDFELKYTSDGRCVKCIDILNYFFSQYIKFLNPLFAYIDNCLRYEEEVCYIPKVIIL